MKIDITSLLNHTEIIQGLAEESNEFLYGIPAPTFLISCGKKTELEITCDKVIHNNAEDTTLLPKVSKKKKYNTQ